MPPAFRSRRWYRQSGQAAPIVVMDPASPSAQAFRDIAQQIAKQVESGMPGHTHASDDAHAHTR